MEDYVLIGPVLQAMHMSKSNKKSKYLKKYQLKNHEGVKSSHNNTICYEVTNTPQSIGRFSMKPNNGTMTAQFFSSAMTQKSQRKKLKMKFILEQSEKICQSDRKHQNHQNLSEFFVKRLIEPKSSRQHCSRTVNIVRTPEITKGYFYDLNTQLIRKKSRKCIILPERRKKQQAILNNRQNFKPINLKQLIKQQWEQTKRKRFAQCKTSSCATRDRNQILKETKRYEQQVRSKENQQKYFKSLTQKQSSHRLCFCQPLNKATIPLTKQQIRAKASDLMQKYGIDTTRCCFKVSIH